jgi:hypothetical protein
MARDILRKPVLALILPLVLPKFSAALSSTGNNAVASHKK